MTIPARVEGSRYWRERPATAFLFVVAFVAAFSLLVLNDRTFEAVASGVAAGLGCLIGMWLSE